MKASFIQAAAFFLKELHDVRRQPQLMLSLVGGPLLVLAAFAATFQSANPFIRTVLVWPEGGVPGVDRRQAEELIGRNLFLVDVVSDEQTAMSYLETGAIDAVQVIPDASAVPAAGAERPQIRVYSRTVDPVKDSWIRSISLGELSAINQALLKQEAGSAQSSAREVSATLESASAELERLRRTVDAATIERAESSAREMRGVAAAFLQALPPVTEAQANIAPELYHVHRDAQLLVDDLDELIAAMEGGEFVTQLERLDSTLDEMEALQGSVDTFVSVAPEDIVSPIRESYTNLRGGAYPMVVFYTPAVLALLLQQLAVTLGALGLVREQQMGAFEMFRVAPLRFSRVLVGKSAAYVAYVAVGGVVLTGLLALLGVPMPTGHPVQFAAFLLALVVAATGFGLAISSVSRTDSQAIQLSMLLLLLSIFFTGFFLPITGFRWPAWLIAALIPMTPGVMGFQDLLLKGEAPPRYLFLWLFVLIGLSYGAVWLIMRRRYRAVA